MTTADHTIALTYQSDTRSGSRDREPSPNPRTLPFEPPKQVSSSGGGAVVIHEAEGGFGG